MKCLHEEFKNLGGEITQDVAVIGKKASNHFSKILDVLRQGLSVFSVILKDLDIEEEDFDKLLDFVSLHSLIRNLEIEDITVSYLRRNIYKRTIISKPEDAVEKSGKLYIQYSFTKPLSRFAPNLIKAIKLVNSRLIFRVRSEEHTPSLELAGMNGTGFSLSVFDGKEMDTSSYREAIKYVCSKVLNITKIRLHNGVISTNIWTCFDQFLNTHKTLEELTIDCRLTLAQIEALSHSLGGNETLKTLHLFNVWKAEDELDGCEEVFKILHKNSALIEFALTCHTVDLGSVASRLLQNRSLRVLRLPKCWFHENTDTEINETFLRNTTICTLSFELINTNCDFKFERFACAMDKNESIEILELTGSECSAIFHRRKTIPDTENNLVPSSPVPVITRPTRRKSKRFLDLFTCFGDKHRRHSHEAILLLPVVPIQTFNRKSVVAEPFYALCNHPHFYKQIQEIAQNLTLKELQVTIGVHVEMSRVALNMKSNSTVTHLKISRRTLTQNDIEILVEGLRDNIILTHLSLNEIIISLSQFHKILDVLRYNQTLRVLDVRQPEHQSDRGLFMIEVKAFASHNPFLKICEND